MASNLTCDLCPPSRTVNRCSLSTYICYGSNGSDFFRLSDLTGSDPTLPSSFPDHFLVFLFFSTSPCASTSGGSPTRTWCEPAFPGASFSISLNSILSTPFTTKCAKQFAILCTLHKTLRFDFSTLHTSYKMPCSSAFPLFFPDTRQILLDPQEARSP